ncbi:serine acetyltransferase [Dissulfurirhabdus thermomarina]|uniref:serine O-acetyltransferase n=2 Tax=Dissulfurirhabdus thermomarina TaxID=1765737 RepID=A0A6N9TP25_DISTH|nr:serine acetyltransferase [Dissulfurirhabdus thermomarina]NMX22883.1 serine acetyltransferase [Dissulfurirhabdus thermomarina]
MKKAQFARKVASDLAAVVRRLCEASRGLHPQRTCMEHREPMPSRAVLVEMVEDLRSVLFPGYFGLAELDAESMEFHVGATLDRVLRVLREQVKRGLCFACTEAQECELCDLQALETTYAFLGRLPEVARILATDVQAAYEGDPAATSPAEAIFCYPGVLAVMNYRLAHELHRLGIPLIPRIITEHAHSITGIDIHPGARIGESFFIDHGTGVVIGETCIIGNRVRIYQGVTLGAKSFPLDEEGRPVKGIPRHPIVEDDVIIYSGATILGRVTIGRGSVIGGNVWLTESVPPGTRVVQAPPPHRKRTPGED